jgi:hypothetical protein
MRLPETRSRLRAGLRSSRVVRRPGFSIRSDGTHLSLQQWNPFLLFVAYSTHAQEIALIRGSPVALAGRSDNHAATVIEL